MANAEMGQGNQVRGHQCGVRARAPLPTFHNFRSAESLAQPSGRVFGSMSLIGTWRHSKTADGLPLSAEERSCSGHHAMTELDPACVKTHTSAKSRRYNSPTRYRTPRAQQLRLHDAQFRRDVSTCATGARVFARPRPGADVRRAGRLQTRYARSARKRAPLEARQISTAPTSALRER